MYLHHIASQRTHVYDMCKMLIYRRRRARREPITVMTKAAKKRKKS